jgi:hypothetical protein
MNRELRDLNGSLPRSVTGCTYSIAKTEQVGNAMRCHDDRNRATGAEMSYVDLHTSVQGLTRTVIPALNGSPLCWWLLCCLFI